MMTGRRLLLLLPLAVAACGRNREAPVADTPFRPDGYAWLTPLRLNVRSVEVVEAPPGPARRTDPPAPMVPADEVARMGRERVLAGGMTGTARFTVETASLVRERLGGGGMFTEPQERLTVVLRCRVEVVSDDGARQAFAEAEARQSSTRVEGNARTAAAHAREVVARAMDELNVEFEVQVRRNLRDWLQDTVPAAPVPPEGGPNGIRREDLSQSG
ncbi:hypothetical protein LPC08_13300 [Roseomonas sp. OT10]|uniref:hypothetical protein n=1 Tax=Roseomonas cutis TaxID=2897332 RepID=UPI001E4E06CF|nr:hypothetical protein [Roseomonas sp. OT10]UFN47004.1 hypothetical protein LPC08_13300 [Roseomonas sp. OT10]